MKLDSTNESYRFDVVNRRYCLEGSVLEMSPGESLEKGVTNSQSLERAGACESIQEGSRNASCYLPLISLVG